MAYYKKNDPSVYDLQFLQQNMFVIQYPFQCYVSSDLLEELSDTLHQAQPGTYLLGTADTTP